LHSCKLGNFGLRIAFLALVAALAFLHFVEVVTYAECFRRLKLVEGALLSEFRRLDICFINWCLETSRVLCIVVNLDLDVHEFLL
jgi:hypothetical protein